jgi:hypothetical protein
MDFREQYLNFDEYRNLEGTLPETPFNLLELRARKIIDKYTFNRLVGLEEQKDEVKGCIMALINEVYNFNKTGGIASESVGSYSVSFNRPVTKEQSSIYKSIVEDYLVMCKLKDGTPYMYCGVE